MSQFAPTPLHGAAYSVAIAWIGGVNAIADCDTQDKYQGHRAALDELVAWSLSQAPEFIEAYRYGIDRVDADLRGRLAIHVNSRAVSAALDSLPRPPRAQP